jgi:CubicO group peptidase (beta-lactamase class C family)
MRMSLGRMLPALIGAATALATHAALAAPACPDGQVAVAEECLAVGDVKQRIDAIVGEAMARHGLKAVLAGFAVGEGPPSLIARGESMTGVPATSDMHFRNGAVAIAYIGTVLLRLHDAGALDLEDRLSKWFPHYPRADEITLTMLINGTSGYADYVTDDGFLRDYYGDPFRHWQPDELIAIALARPMACDPGKCWSYAHTNFVILGKVLEKAGGRSLDALIREGILDPLDLADTRSEPTAIIQEPVLHAFDAERGRYEESTYWDPSWTLASGAIMTSNITDILRSAAAIGEGTLLSPESHELQLAPLTAGLAPWNDTKYYGMGVVLLDGWMLQNPSFAGYAATMAYLPSRRLALAVSVTLQPSASPESNLSTEVLKEIAAYLAPEAPL